MESPLPLGFRDGVEGQPSWFGHSGTLIRLRSQGSSSSLWWWTSGRPRVAEGVGEHAQATLRRKGVDWRVDSTPGAQPAGDAAGTAAFSPGSGNKAHV